MLTARCRPPRVHDTWAWTFRLARAETIIPKVKKTVRFTRILLFVCRLLWCLIHFHHYPLALESRHDVSLGGIAYRNPFDFFHGTDIDNRDIIAGPIGGKNIPAVRTEG
jgi:hypothetical protein